MKSHLNDSRQRIRVAELIQEISAAQIVRAIDRKTGNASIVFGRAVLESVKNSAIPSRLLACLDYTIDFSESCDDLEFLVAAVKVAKGRHEYAG